MREPWSQVSLRAVLAEDTPGFWGDPPSAAGNIAVLRSTNLRANGRLDFSDVVLRSFPDKKLQQKTLAPGDLLLERSGGGPKQPVGRVALFAAQGAYSFSNFMQRLRPAPTLCDSEYLLYTLWHFHATGGTEQLQQATTGIRNLQYQAYLNRLIALPPLAEQQKIAAILSSVDDVIEKTEAVIAHLQVVKKAMMQELLTGGLPGRHTRFKMTEVGEVPEEWEVTLLDSVARRGSGHTPDKKHPEYWDGEVKWVSLKDSYQLDRVYIADTAAKITPAGIANSSAVEHPAGTVVLSRDAGVGKSAITTDVMAVSQHFMAWHCGPRLNNHFLYYWLQSQKPEFERIAIGNTIKTIGLPYFKALMVPLPPLDEQVKTADALLSVDRRVFAEEATLSQLRATKAAVATALLSGEVRVSLDEEVAA